MPTLHFIIKERMSPLSLPMYPVLNGRTKPYYHFTVPLDCDLVKYLILSYLIIIYSRKDSPLAITVILTLHLNEFFPL